MSLEIMPAGAFQLLYRRVRRDMKLGRPGAAGGGGSSSRQLTVHNSQRASHSTPIPTHLPLPRRLPLDVQSGEYPVLPLSIPGAVSMTHAPDSDVLLSGDEWFIFKVCAVLSTVAYPILI